MKSRRRFITDFVIALMPLGATASAQEYKAQPAGRVARLGREVFWPDDSSNARAAGGPGDRVASFATIVGQLAKETCACRHRQPQNRSSDR